MADEETRRRTQELIRQIQDKSMQLSDLEVILQDYERERQALLREIGRLKASLWESLGSTDPPRRAEDGLVQAPMPPSNQ